jgi:hypothetical protein
MAHGRRALFRLLNLSVGGLRNRRRRWRRPGRVRLQYTSVRRVVWVGHALALAAAKACELGLILLVVLLTAPTRAEAQSWNLYSGPSVLVSYANAMTNSNLTNTPTVNLALSGGPMHAFPMDTGSTGIIASPEYFQPAAGAQNLGPGSIAYTSSGIKNVGTWYTATQNIYGANGNLVATANVPVLQVTELSCLPGYPNCPYMTPKNCTTTEKCDVAFMGIGFDRQSNPQQPLTTPSYNPLLNLTGMIPNGGMSRFLLNIEKRSVPRLMLSGDGVASKDAV